MGAINSRRNAVLMTALNVETKAVLSYLKVRETIEVDGTVFYVGDVNGIKVAVVEIGSGNARAAAMIERAVRHFDPQIALLVGVAGGVKDVAIGDVVVASKVYGYESGKDEANEFKPRPEVFISAHAIEQRSRALCIDDGWKNSLTQRENVLRRLFVGPIAAGEKVIASRRSAVGQFLRARYSDTLAVEMEGRGFLEGAHMSPRVLAGVVRGISDLLSKKASADAKGSQEIASDSAAAVAFELLATMLLPPAPVGGVGRMTAPATGSGSSALLKVSGELEEIASGCFAWLVVETYNKAIYPQSHIKALGVWKRDVRIGRLQAGLDSGMSYIVRLTVVDGMTHRRFGEFIMGAETAMDGFEGDDESALVGLDSIRVTRLD